MARRRGDSTAKGGGGDVKKTAEVHEKRISRASGSRSPEKRLSAVPKSGAASSLTSSSNVLSVDSLAKLNAENERQQAQNEKVGGGRPKQKVANGRVYKDRTKQRKRRRVVSGAALEEGRAEHGRGRRGGYMPTEAQKRKYGPCFWIVLGVLGLLLIILIPVGVLVVGKKGNGGGGASDSGGDGKPSNSNLKGVSPNDIPVSEGSRVEGFS